ncbi:INO80 complex subunit B [Hydra vulgaris]|uniref:INO80 complex subunit B n=1 Tax=Hydra vulgaris TaxID=6087 RepID=UPI001F5ED47C|nr:INO80 complex subunit B [Hydra vulgaris]
MANKKDKNELSKKRQKKHKKHKKKRDKEEAEDIDVVTEDKEVTQTLKLKIRFGGETLTAKLKAKNDKDDLSKKIKKHQEEEEEEMESKDNHNEEDSLLDEEDSWLVAMEKGNLDSYGEIKKNKDPAVMTARQRALKGESVEGEMELLQLPMYPERSVEEVEEIERKRKLRAKKRRQDSKQKIEETKIQTIEKLLTKSKVKKEITKNTKKLGAHMRYTSNINGFFISLSEDVEFPLIKQEMRVFPDAKICAVQGCGKPKKYSCSKTYLPVCSLQCYNQIVK